MSESNGHAHDRAPVGNDEASSLVAQMLGKYLAGAQRGRWKFAAVVLVDDDGGVETDFKGALRHLHAGNFGADIVKGNMIVEFLRHVKQPSPLIVRAREGDLPKGG